MNLLAYYDYHGGYDFSEYRDHDDLSGSTYFMLHVRALQMGQMSSYVHDMISAEVYAFS